MPKTPIILIGPMATGKSTIALELANLTKIRNVPMDRVRWYYYFQDGFSLEKEVSLDSFHARLNYWKPFELKAVRKIINEFQDAIIDFGAGHSYYTEEKHFEEAKELLAPIANVFLLLPSDDKEESMKICNERLKIKLERDLKHEEIDANRDFIYGKSNYELAKRVIYTKEKSPTTIAEEIKTLL